MGEVDSNSPPPRPDGEGAAPTRLDDGDYRDSYIEQLIGEYHTLKAAQPDPLPPQVKKICDCIDLIVSKPHGTRTWSDAYILERALLWLMPDARLRRNVWTLRKEFLDIAGRAQYDAYLASQPPVNPNDPSVPVDVLRADCDQLLSELHWLYATIGVSERERDRLSATLALFTSIVAAVLVGAMGFALSLKMNAGPQKYVDGITTIALVVIAGSLGGLFSAQQRLMALPMEGNPIAILFGLIRSSFTFKLSPLIGAVAALVLYYIFAGDLLSGSLFPKITTFPLKESGEPLKTSTTVKDFFRLTVPESGVAFAKLLVWSFIAGFAERFVPDTLDRFVARAQLDAANTGPAAGVK